jgi:hypothetical protein
VKVGSRPGPTVRFALWRAASLAATWIAGAGCGATAASDGVDASTGGPASDAPEDRDFFVESDSAFSFVPSDAAPRHDYFPADASFRTCAAEDGGLDLSLEGGASARWTSGCNSAFPTIPAAVYFVAPGESFSLDACGSDAGQSLVFYLGARPPVEAGTLTGTLDGRGLPGLPDGPLKGTVRVDFTSVADVLGDVFAGTYSADVDLGDAGHVPFAGAFEACLTTEATE